MRPWNIDRFWKLDRAFPGVTLFVQFQSDYLNFRRGQIVGAGKGHDLGGGVAEMLLSRRIAKLVPGEPNETEPREAMRDKRPRRGQ